MQIEMIIHVVKNQSKLKLEPLSLQSLIAVFVKAVFDRGTGAMSWRAIIHLAKHTKVLHLVRKITTIELNFQDGLIQILKLR